MLIPHQYPEKSLAEGLLDVAFWLVTAAGVIYFILHFDATAQTADNLHLIPLFILWVVVVWPLVIVLNRFEQKRDEAYYAHLDDFELDVLKRAMHSVEMKRRSCKAIRAYLDKKRPGWSMQ